ncbi:polyphosphate polymerase domain-containing protein [Miniimonas arenae]|uniref:Polyphosphate polymerase domain-containing protein n=1 Tax=Miniimonas arenae TaxID=676201 RepID=A0A5C5BA31_9MICO|nr:polyphosphate polymerase domain-containing protein [Miniimonas arenae]TNU72872.1 polyphosphate polymerase domain-containing protein [Miniimonas arenae]
MTARPISLEELLAVAELQTRVDRKYLLPTSQLALIDDADPDLRVLEIAGSTSHRYASCYLDTADLESYLLAAHGRPRRYKVRTRTYRDSGEEFLEVKTRSVRGETVKDRLPLAEASRTERHRFAPATVRERTGIELPAVSPLQPVLDVTYSRTTYLLPASDSRVTVDTDLEWTQVHTGRRLALPGWAVVETKTTGRPCALDHLLWHSGIRPRRMSKYTCGLALTGDTDLPTNRWHRTMTQLREHAVVPAAAA